MQPLDIYSKRCESESNVSPDETEVLLCMCCLLLDHLRQGYLPIFHYKASRISLSEKTKQEPPDTHKYETTFWKNVQFMKINSFNKTQTKEKKLTQLKKQTTEIRKIQVQLRQCYTCSHFPFPPALPPPLFFFPFLLKRE